MPDYPVAIVDQNQTTRALVADFVRARGYDVIQADTAHNLCALYSSGLLRCPKNQPCASAVIASSDGAIGAGLELLSRQVASKCRGGANSKAIFATSSNPTLERRVRAMGCAFFVGERSLERLHGWLRMVESAPPTVATPRGVRHG